MQTWISNLLGYFFAIIIGHWLTFWVADTLWSESGWMENKYVQRFAYTPSLLGLVERALFLAALQFDQSQFIAVWLAMKVAGQWNRWEKGADIGTAVIPGRAFYNFFLIGTGFSIAYSVVGFSIISSINSGDCLSAVIIPISLIVVTILFVLLTKYYQRKYHQKFEEFNKKDA